MKRPGIVWLFSIYIFFGMIWNLFGIIGLFSGVVLPMSAFVIATGIINLILLIFTALMIYHFFMLKKKAKYWTNISLGSGLIINIFKEIFIAPHLETTIPPTSIIFTIIGFAIYILIWWAIINYIRKKKVDGQPLFK